ncbi:MAG TPA: lytic polysaccharide monooxygenase [Kineosporiaceae bacterium]|nr:lytic polysaccharide monooxygenase [Kineosporiaceae bacterium]
MSSRRRWLGLGVVLALLASAGGAWLAGSAQAHGANASPGSRTYLCFKDAHHTGGDLDARNPACKQAIADGGKQPLWDWPGVGNSATKGRTRGFIPDGKICSANNKTYAAYDAARADWPATHLTSGAKWDFRFPSHDGHPGTFSLYITKDGYDPTKPLAWDDLESKPCDTHTFPAPNASGSDGREFDWNITLPAHKTGKHLLLTYWQRSDADGAFFSCSDVVFDGGHGEISGFPNDNQWKGTGPAPTAPAADAAPRGDMFVETFEDGDFDDWYGLGGSWRVMKTGWSIANVLQQSNLQGVWQQVSGDVRWADYRLTAHLRAAECDRSDTCAFGMSARMAGDSQARLVLFPGYGGQLEVIRNGKVRVAASVPFDMRTRQWRIIELAVRGDTVTAIIDGTVIGTATGIPASGEIGIFTQAASASFDNLDVYRLK